MKKIVALLMTFVLIFGTLGVAYANVDGVTYTGENGYTATKLSNPELGSGEVDGLVQYDGETNVLSDDNLLNDRGQNYAWASVGYGDDVYVGTCFGAIYQTLRIIAMENGMDYADMKKVIDVLYNGDLYNGDDDKAVTTNRSVLIKLNTKTKDVSIVHGPTTAGGYRAAVEFQDKLYFAVTGSTPYLLEVDPADDSTQVVCYSEKPQSMSISTGIRGLAVYQNMLVATMIGNNGAYMVASENPSEGQDTFKTICTQEDLLDYPAYHYMDSIFGGSIWDIIEYNNKLYITVVTGKNGDKQAFALFSGEIDKDGAWSFDLIAGNPEDGAEYPYGLGSSRSGAANLIVHDGHLYIGGYNDPMVALPDALNMEFESLYRDLASPVCLWRLDTEGKIEMVAGEANEVFPEGPIGNMGAGFGSNMNQYVWRMASYDGQLYLGTFDVTGLAYPLAQFANGEILKRTEDEWNKQIEYIKVLLESVNGSAVMSRDGSNERTELIEDLTEMEVLMEDMAALYDSKGDDRTTYSLKTDREIFYRLLAQLVEKYEEIKDQLPEELTSALDDVLNYEVVENFEYFIETCALLSTSERGFDLFVSDDGENFDVITRNGLGDPYNHGCRVFAITDTGLCIGTANPYYGCQVWQLDKDIENSVLASTSGTYDKKDKGDLSVEITFNGNTVDKIECDYNKLVEGEDYVVTSNGVTFTEEYLMSLDKDSEHNLTFFFNVGARGHYELKIVETAAGTDTPAGTTDSNVPGENVPGTGDATTVALYIVLLAIAGAAACGLARGRKEN